MALRIGANRSLSEPLQIATSGWGEALLFKVWKFVHGWQIYTDPYLAPYDLAVYNWLHYQVYGHFSKTALDLFGLSDAWIPTVAGFLTLIGTILSAVILWRAVLLISRPASRELRLLAGIFAVYAFLGPLIGFWALAVRADIWSGVFDLLAIVVFWKFLEKSPMKAVLLAAALLFVAWSFKQIGVFGTIAIGTFLLIEWRWRLLAVYCAVLWFGYAATMLLGGETYTGSLFFSAQSGFSQDFFTKTVSNFLVKSTPVLVPCFIGSILLFRNPGARQSFLRDERARFALVGTVVLTAVSTFGAGHTGSAENYFFITHAFWVLLTMTIARHVLEGGPDGEAALPPPATGWFRLGMGAGWSLHAAAVVLVLVGVQGVIDLKPFHRKTVAIARCIEHYPKPAYTDHQFASLPWNNPSEPVLFPHWFYLDQRKAGVAFPDGGIGGLIMKGHFATLLLGGPYEAYDLAPLDGYRREPETCGDLVVYRRIDDGDPVPADR